MRKIAIVSLSFLAGWSILLAANLARAIEPNASEATSVSGIVETTEGTIDSVDTEKKTVTLRWMNDPVMLRYENIALKVFPSTIIMKNSAPIELDDIESGDHATVRYDPNAIPSARALSIDIEE